MIECACCGVRVPKEFWYNNEKPVCAVCGNSCYIEVDEVDEEEEEVKDEVS